MDYNALPLLLAIAETGSLSGAAAKLRVDTSTVSRRLRAHEESLGTKLFEAKGRVQVPTHAGERAIETAQQIGAQIVDLETELINLDARLSGKVRVTAPPTVARYQMVAPLAEFGRLYPDIEIELLATDKILSIPDRQTDVAVRATYKPSPSLVGRRVGGILYGFFASEGYLRAHHETGGAHRYVAWRQPEAAPQGMREAFPDAKVALRVDDLSVMVAAAQEGIGMALLPRLIGQKERGLVLIQDDPIDYNFELWVLTHADLKGTARVRALAEHLHKTMRADMAPFRNHVAPS